MTLNFGVKMRRSKYGNTKVIYNGMKFDSKRELKRWHELVLLEKAGEIHVLKRQVPCYFEINGEYMVGDNNHKTRYVADFTYFCMKDKKTIVEDSKGFKTPEYKLKKAMMRLFHGIDILET